MANNTSENKKPTLQQMLSAVKKIMGTDKTVTSGDVLELTESEIVHEPSSDAVKNIKNNILETLDNIIATRKSTNNIADVTTQNTPNTEVKKDTELTPSPALDNENLVTTNSTVTVLSSEESTTETTKQTESKEEEKEEEEVLVLSENVATISDVEKTDTPIDVEKEKTIENTAIEEKEEVVSTIVVEEAKVEATETTPVKEGGLLSNKSLVDSLETIRILKKTVKQPLSDGLSFRSGVTMEELVIEAMKPKLSEWLDTNLPNIVKHLVEKEIKKLIPNDD